MEKEVKIFKAIGDDTRLKILFLLLRKNICAKGIARHLDISEAAVSQHIKILKEADLIVAYKQGYFVKYEINQEALESAENLIKFLSHKENESIKKKDNYIIAEFDASICKRTCKSINRCCRKDNKEE